MRCRNYQEANWEKLLGLWVVYNEWFAHVIANIDPGEWSRECSIGDGRTVTFGFVINDYLRHLSHHLKQLERQG